MFSFFCFCIWTRHIHQIVACIRNGVDFAIKKTSKSYLQALYNQAFNIVLGGQLQKKYYLCREQSVQGKTGHFLHFFFKVLFKWCCFLYIQIDFIMSLLTFLFVFVVYLKKIEHFCHHLLSSLPFLYFLGGFMLKSILDHFFLTIFVCHSFSFFS